MSQFFLPKMTILPEAQNLLWPKLQPARSLGFVLYGGTAIALRLGHRLSVDFDFFSDKSLNKEKIKSLFPFVSSSTVLQDEPETFTLLIKSHQKAQDSYVKVSFFGRLRFGRIGEPELTEDEIL